MKLKIILLLLSIIATQIVYAQYSPKEIHALKIEMVKAVEDAALTNSLFDKLNQTPHKTPLFIAYIGTLEALKAKHAWNPYNKIKYVSRSLKTMQKAINLDGENMEIRFIRFSIEHFTPSFLGFSKDLDLDRKEIIKHFENKNFGLANEEFINNVAKFMIESNRCTPAEISILKKNL